MGAPSLRSYKAGGEFIVNQPLDWHGRVFKTGEPFPWRDLGVHEVKVHELWRANLIDCADPSTHANRLDVIAERATALAAAKPSAAPAKRK